MNTLYLKGCDKVLCLQDDSCLDVGGHHMLLSASLLSRSSSPSGCFLFAAYSNGTGQHQFNCLWFKIASVTQHTLEPSMLLFALHFYLLYIQSVRLIHNQFSGPWRSPCVYCFAITKQSHLFYIFKWGFIKLHKDIIIWIVWTVV